MMMPATVPAQVEIVVSDEIACPRCEITLRPIATIGKLEDRVALGVLSEFAVDPHGRIYAALTYLPGALVMYDWEGNLLDTFGRTGRGPGEFSTSSLNFHLLIDRAGDLQVIEAGRRTTVRAGLTAAVRTHPLGQSFDGVAALDNGQLLLTSSTLRRARDPHRFVLLDSVGGVVRRFGAMPTDPDASPIFLAPADSIGFWAPYLWEYRVERYDPAGTLQLVIMREADWFPAPDPDSRVRPFSRPTFGKVYDAGNGRLWTAVRVPAADRARADAALQETQRLDQLDWDAVQDTRLEVIDTRTGRLLASAAFDEALRFLDNGYIVQLRETPEGLIQAIVSAVSLTVRDTGSE